MKFLLLIILTPFLIFFSASADVTDESNLKKELFKSYDKTLRPSTRVDLSLKLSLRQIIGLNEKSQIITTSSYLFAYWLDTRLVINKII